MKKLLFTIVVSLAVFMNIDSMAFAQNRQLHFDSNKIKALAKELEIPETMAEKVLGSSSRLDVLQKGGTVTATINGRTVNFEDLLDEESIRALPSIRAEAQANKTASSNSGLQTSARQTISAFGGTFYLMTEDEVNQSLSGSFTLNSPPHDGRIDPDNGASALVVTPSGFKMVEPFVQYVYPAKSAQSNVNGEVSHEADYYDGRWYRGTIQGDRIFIYIGYKTDLTVMKFENGQWAGNAKRVVETTPTTASIIYIRNGVYYYRGQSGDYRLDRH